MNRQISIQELSGEVLGELRRLEYSEASIALFRRAFSQLEEYASNVGQDAFSEKLAVGFLNWKFGKSMTDLYSHTPDTVYLGNFLRCMRVLLEYQVAGVICRRVSSKAARAALPPALREALDSFDAACRADGLAESTVRSRGGRIKDFLLFLADRGVEDCPGITPASASEYVRDRAAFHEKSVQSDLAAIRRFYKHLYLTERLSDDLTGSVPKPKRHYASALPVEWSADEIDKLVTGIDRGNPVGMRDYAMLLMIARLGLRSCDVRSLKLGDIDWAEKRIDIVQRKTGVPLSLPLPDDVGWAIIDYLKRGRPRGAQCDEIFTRHRAPYEPLGSGFSNILAKRMNEAGVKPGEGRKTVHSLRHALATSLLDGGASVEDVGRVLGHVNARTTSIYLHLDIEGLRDCALNPEAVAR